MKRFHKIIWDRSNIEHVAKHRILPEEVDEVCVEGRSLILRGWGKNIYYMLGQSYGGRYIFVVVHDCSKGFARPITARDMSNREKKRYRNIRR